MKVESYILIVLLIFLGACEKNELPEQADSPEGVFEVDFLLDGNHHNIIAGPNNVVAEAEIIYDDLDTPLLNSNFGTENCESCFSRLIEFELSTEHYDGQDFTDFIQDIDEFEVVSDVFSIQNGVYVSEIENFNPSDNITIDFIELGDLIEIENGLEYLNLSEGLHQMDYTLNNGFYSIQFDLNSNNSNQVFNSTEIWKENGVFKLKVNEETEGISQIIFGTGPDQISLNPGEIFEVPSNAIVMNNLQLQIMHSESNVVLFETLILFDADSFNEEISSIEFGGFELEFENLELFEKAIRLKYFDENGNIYISFPTSNSYFNILDIEFYSTSENNSEIYNATVEFSISCQNILGEIVVLDSEQSNIPIRFREN